MGKPIEGKIAAVVSTREVAIIRGSDHGVAEGMVFAIIGGPIQITDPDTGKTIGSVDREKLRVRVSEVREEFCIARTLAVTPGWMTTPIFGLGSLAPELPPTSPEEERPVRTGDRVRQVGGSHED
ncbi:MAG: hypothetical protein Q8Q00_07805 [Dehalococcoidia bacterium]|nr:hypothetical protein [Dehalococcoidia bacterium]